MSTQSSPKNPWTLVAAREIRIRLRDKNFIASFLVTIGLIAASFGLSAFVSNRTQTVDIAVSNSAGTQLVQQAATLAKASDDKLELKPKTVTDGAAVRGEVRDEKADLGLVATGDGLTLVGRESTDVDATPFLQQAYASSRLASNAQAAGTSVDQLTAGSTLTTQELDPNGVSSLTLRIAGMIFGFLFFFASILFGLAIAQSVTAEKENRIVEILAGLVPIRQLLIGKIIGNSVLAFGQLLVMAVVALVGLRVSGLADNLPSAGGAVLWFLAFFFVGFLALAALWASAGAMATRNEDLQQTQNPVMMLLGVVLFAGIYLPDSAQQIASFIPMVNIVSMPTRLIGGGVAWWEPVVSLLILAAAAVALVLLAERIYRRSLMQTGGRLTMRQALKLSD
ncbi:ABC transporter permease [Dermacoccaceae bacterium W4C1]